MLFPLWEKKKVRSLAPVTFTPTQNKGLGATVTDFCLQGLFPIHEFSNFFLGAILSTFLIPVFVFTVQFMI